MMDPKLALGVIGYSISLSLVTECILYLYIYRTPAFKNLKANLEKHSKRLAEAEAATSSKNLKKKQARLDTWRDEAAKQVAPIQWRIGLVTMVVLFAGFKFLNSLFWGKTVASLPFEPPSFLQKATHRGLEGAEITDCSAMFLYGLAQASLRPMITKLLGWGPSRAMLEVKPFVPRPLKEMDLFKQQ